MRNTMTNQPDTPDSVLLDIEWESTFGQMDIEKRTKLKAALDAAYLHLALEAVKGLFTNVEMRPHENLDQAVERKIREALVSAFKEKPHEAKAK